MDEALELFDKMPFRDTVCWNSMMNGCLEYGYLCTAQKLFDEMPERNVVSWTTMVNGYMQVGRIEDAEGLFTKMPFRDIAAWNSMIYGYFCNGKVGDAMRIFEEMPRRNVISWTSIISGLDQHGRSEKALFLFRQMMDCSVEPTLSTFSSVITACANVPDLGLGVQVHALIIILGCSIDPFVTASLVTFYAKCKQINDSVKVFNEKLHENVVTWTSLLTGYGSNNRHEEGLGVFKEMMKIGVFPNQSSFTSALNSCCELDASEKGKEIHATATKMGLVNDAFVGNSLIVLYSKCGNVKDGVTIFKEIHETNIVSWNSIIVGCAQNGFGMWAISFFAQMLRNWIDFDEVTVTGLLSACSHSGMLEKGKHFFEYFAKCDAIELKLEHYACMVDILGRNGELKEAKEVINNMPVEPNRAIWLTLLSACRMHKNFELAEEVANCVFEMDSDCSAAYVLLSNLYASVGRWSDVNRVRCKMEGMGIRKQTGFSWVEGTETYDSFGT